MFDKGKREQRHQEEDAAFNKMLLWLAGAVVVELLILLVKNIYIDITADTFEVAFALDRFFQVFSWLGAVLTAAGIVWAVLYRRKGKRLIVPCICAAVAAGLWVLSVLSFYLRELGVDILLLLPAMGAVLIVVFFLYQRVFFLNTLMTAGGLLVLWLYRQHYMEHPNVIRLFFVVGLVLLAVGLVVSFLLRRGGGKLGGLRVLPPDTNYLITWITCGVTALTMVLTLALGTAAGLYLLFGLVAWLFIQAVFYTVQLM